MEAIYDSTAKVFLYLTIALVAAGIIGMLILNLVSKEKLKRILKIVLNVYLVYFVAVAVTMLALKFECIKEEGVDKSYYLLLYPIVATLAVFVAGWITLAIVNFKCKDKVKVVLYIFGVLLIGCFVALMVCMTKYFEVVRDWYPNTNLTGLITTAVVCMALLILTYFLSKKESISDTRSLVYGAICIALSFALSYIKFFRMPQGGSITFASMLPLLIYTCMFGTRRGIIICLIYGTLQAVQDPWIIHPMQFLLDYPLAYGVIAIGGIVMERKLFKKQIINFVLGGVIAVILRYICHVCSGVFAFADYADLDNYASALIYSLAYNSSVFIDMVVALVCGSFMFASKSFASLMDASAAKETAGEEVVLNDSDDEIDKMIIENQENDIANENK